jgi:trk system potassium uptake protein TrkA
MVDMKVIVIGIGEVGRHVAGTLSADRHDVTVIEQDPARVESTQQDLDALVVQGSGASPRLLREVGAGETDLVCAVTQNDEANVIAALTAHQLGARQTIARVRDDDYYDDDQSLARDVLGIDVVIHPERATAEDLAEAILLPGAVHVEHFADGRVSVAETIVTTRSSLIDRPLGERTMVRPSFVFGLIRDGRVMAAEAYHQVRAGDRLLVAAARHDIGRVVAALAGRTEEVRSAMLFGGGRVGLALASRLEAAALHVSILESDAATARYAAERLPRTTVLHEETASKEALLRHGVDRAGAFVACASDDRSNLLAALHAQLLGAGLCLSVVSREEYTPLVDALGIDAAVSPRLVTAEAILRSLRGVNVAAMHLMLGGAEILEVHAPAGCEAEGRSIESTAALAKARVAAIVRGDKVLFPLPDERVRAGDRLLVFNPRRGVADVQRSFQAA